jgi:ABC-type multidrug transport system ATPase subunit
MLGRRDVLDLLAGIKSAGRTILFSTHIPEEAERMCDYLLIISEGRLIAEGKIIDVLKKAGSENLEDAFISLLKLERV